MKAARVALAMIVALLIACPLLAADKEKKRGEKKAPPCPAEMRINRITEGLTLTDDQKAKLDAIKKECGPKMMEAMKKMDAVLTPEQRKARGEASKAAQAAGKSRKEVAEAAEAAMKLTDDQKAKLADAKKEMGGMEKDLQGKVLAVLTAEQQEQVKQKMHKPHGKRAEKK